MKIKCIFEELDCNGNIVNRKIERMHKFNVDSKQLCQAVIRGNGDRLPIPPFGDIQITDSGNLTKFYDLNQHHVKAIKKAYADFPSWRLHFNLSDSNKPPFKWEMV